MGPREGTLPPGGLEALGRVARGHDVRIKAARSRRPWLRLLVLSQLVGFGVAGLAQFATTLSSRPGSSIDLGTPARRIRLWIGSGCRTPLGADFDTADRLRVGLTVVGIVVPGILLARSARSLWPSRPLRPRLGATMALAAAVALQWAGARASWDTWCHWEYCLSQAEFHGDQEVFYREMARKQSARAGGPGRGGDRAGHIDFTAEAAYHAQLRRLYEHAVWLPWAEVDTSQVPLPMELTP